MSQIVNFYEDSENEKILMLFTAISKGGPDEIVGIFRVNNHFVSFSNDRYIQFSSSYLTSCIRKCKKTKNGFAIIHNHKIDCEPSRSDIETEAKILKIVNSEDLERFYFMIFDMNERKIRVRAYDRNGETYLKQEYIVDESLN